MSPLRAFGYALFLCFISPFHFAFDMFTVYRKVNIIVTIIFAFLGGFFPIATIILMIIFAGFLIYSTTYELMRNKVGSDFEAMYAAPTHIYCPLIGYGIGRAIAYFI